MPQSQFRCKVLYQRLTILSPLFTLLFILNNLPPDLLVGADHFMIDHRMNTFAGGFNYAGDASG
jgi:hypothetical protein